jgi:beta-glucosidase
MTKKFRAGKKPGYKDSRLPAAARVKDLLARMTLDEKAAQMMCMWQEKASKLLDGDGNLEQNYL